MDEPLSNLDAKLRVQMRTVIKKLQRRLGITTIYVTHDQEEALTMSDTIVVMNDGIIQQIGTPEMIYNEPKNTFVANFIGESNIIDGVMKRDYLANFCGRDFECVDRGFDENERVTVVIRPEDIDIIPVTEGEITGKVVSVVFMGVHYDIHMTDADGADWRIHTTDFAPVGSEVSIKFGPDDIHIMHRSMYDLA